MTPSIPASQVVSVTPQVIDAGGIGLDLIGLMLTNSIQLPIGTIGSFPTLAEVVDYFGAGSTEATLAAVYFAGYDNSPIKPASLLFYQCPTATNGVGGYLRGGDVSALTLAQLRAGSGALSMTVDGRTINTSTIVLNAVNSFSDAAAAIQTGLNDQAASFTGVIAVTTGILTASSVTGTIAPGQNLTGTGVPAGTTITSQLSGTTGGAGTYQTSITTAVASTAMKSGVTTVTYDTISGGFVIKSGTPNGGTITFPTSSAGVLVSTLKLAAADGAVISPGAPLGVPATVMAAVTALTTDFASFMTTFEAPTADCVAYAAWVSGQNNRYLYCFDDSDTVPTTNSDTTSAGYQIRSLEYSGSVPIYNPTGDGTVSAFLMGYGASLDFNRTNARAVAKFRSGTGLTPGVTDATIASNLAANGYNFYGRYATANDTDTFFANGVVSGAFVWIDSYFNQIWMSNAFQRTLLDLLLSVGQIPYNNDGYGLIEAAMSDQVQAALNFGAIQAGVTLSLAQAAQVNNAAGKIVSDVIQQRGWYLQVQDASPAVRALRESPPIYFWYTDGQSVQKIDLTSALIQ